MMTMVFTQAELDKRESQWAAAVDNLRLRSCEEQVGCKYKYKYNLRCRFNIFSQDQLAEKVQQAIKCRETAEAELAQVRTVHILFRANICCSTKYHPQIDQRMK